MPVVTILVFNYRIEIVCQNVTRLLYRYTRVFVMCSIIISAIRTSPSMRPSLHLRIAGSECGSITHQYVSISLRGLSTLHCCILPFVATCSRMLNLNKKLPQYFHKKCNVALTGQIHRMIAIICWLNRMLESTGNCFTGMTVRLLTSSGRGCANVSVDVSWYK